MKPILVFQHLPLEGPGRILPIAKERGLTLECVHFMEVDDLPSHQDYSALIALGGSMNVYEEDVYPWLGPETRYIGQWVRAGKPYLGLCLGGQLLAKATGGLVTKTPRKEIGNFQVSMTKIGRDDPIFEGINSSFPVFQWHGDTFSQLGLGVCLATSDWCQHQAFRVGQKAYGMQFHAEITQEMAGEWLHEFNPEIVEEGLNPELIYEQFQQLDSQYHEIAKRLFGNFFKIAGL